MHKEKGNVLLIVLFIVITGFATLYFLIFQGIIPLPFNLPGIPKKQTESQVTQKPESSESSSYLKEEYKNPFEEKSQYSNPFDSEDSYTNPFEGI